MIEVGEYVKLDNGKIGKVITVEKGSIMLDLCSNRWVGLCCIKNHSKNIIDLIEAGDYVNGEPVEKIERNEIDLIEITTTTEYLVNEKDIETILTHEIYEREAYKIE